MATAPRTSVAAVGRHRTTVAIALALVAGPAVLLADEPTYLDSAHGDEVMRLLRGSTPRPDRGDGDALADHAAQASRTSPARRRIMVDALQAAKRQITHNLRIFASAGACWCANHSSRLSNCWAGDRLRGLFLLLWFVVTRSATTRRAARERVYVINTANFIRTQWMEYTPFALPRWRCAAACR